MMHTVVVTHVALEILTGYPWSAEIEELEHKCKQQFANEFGLPKTIQVFAENDEQAIIEARKIIEAELGDRWQVWSIDAYVQNDGANT